MWLDSLLLRVITDKRVSETRYSLNMYDMEYLFKLNEFLDIQDYIQEVQHKESEKQSKQAENNKNQKGKLPFV